MDIYKKLKELKSLLDNGLLNQDEFEKLKNEILFANNEYSNQEQNEPKKTNIERNILEEITYKNRNVLEDISKNKNTFFNYLKTRIASNRCIDFDFIDYFAKVQNPDLTNVEDLLDENKRFTTDERNHQYYYYLSMKAIQTKNPAIIQKAIDILQSLS